MGSGQQSKGGRGNCRSWEEAPTSTARGAADPESGSRESDGFLWPEAVAEIAFLPPHSSDLPPPRLRTAEEPTGAVSQAAIQDMPFIASQGTGLHCLGGASPNVGNKDT